MCPTAVYLLYSLWVRATNKVVITWGQSSPVNIIARHSYEVVEGSVLLYLFSGKNERPATVDWPCRLVPPPPANGEGRRGVGMSLVPKNKERKVAAQVSTCTVTMLRLTFPMYRRILFSIRARIHTIHIEVLSFSKISVNTVLTVYKYLRFKNVSVHRSR